jgi:hypothetical protein
MKQREVNSMSIWMLLVFALCMLTARLSFGAPPERLDVALPLFLFALLVFLIGLVTRGIRRPVV